MRKKYAKTDKHLDRSTRSPASPAGLPDMLTAKDLEALLKIDVKTIYGYAKRGLIPYVRIESNLRFARTEILEWIERHSYRPRPVNGHGNGKRQ